MKISIFGLGYVGCVSLTCLAQDGHEIIGVDPNEDKIQLINEAKSPIIEKDLDMILSKQHMLGKISTTTNTCDAVKYTDISFVCVGTPSTSNGHLDLSAVYNVSKQIAQGIKEKKDFHTIVIRSTVTPGTNDTVSKLIAQESGKIADKNFAVVSNPEFLREGSAVVDYYNPPYTLVGTRNKESIDKLLCLYQGVNAPFITADIEVVEMIKYVNNSFHALKICFANEIGNICKKLKIDSRRVMDIFCLDTKLNISAKYLKPGFAYGGSCLPKDLRALYTIAHDHYLDCPLLHNIERSNEYQIQYFFEELLKSGKQKIGFLGLSFKAGTDDLRNSPIIDIIERLLGKGFDIKIYDKNVHLSKLLGANKQYILKKIPLISRFITDNMDDVVKHSDVIVIVNKEPEFNTILNNYYRNKIIYDLVSISDDDMDSIENYIGISW